MRGTVTLGLLLVLAAPALAQPAARADRQRAKQARQAFDSGQKAYDLGDFDRAIELWKQGYELRDDPMFLHGIGQAYEGKREPAKALYYYRGYLREAPRARDRAEVEQKMAELQREIEAGERSPEPPPLPPAPPPESVTPREIPPPPEVVSHPGRGMRTGGIVGMSIGAAALGAATFFALRAGALERDIERATRAGDPWTEELADKESQGKTMNTLSLIGFSVGAAAVATGGILYYLGARKDALAASERVVLLPRVGARGANVSLRVTF